MSRLTQKDDQGNWSLRGVKWEQLHVGQTITQEVSEKLYGALWKLMEYEDTRLEPEEIEELRERNQKQKMSKPNPNAYCCPECGESLNPMWSNCPWCGQHVED